MASNLDPDGWKRVRLGEVVADEERLLTSDQLDLLSQLRDHKIPFRPSMLFFKLAEANDKRIADEVLARFTAGDDGSDELRFVDGGAFIHDLPEKPPALWGDGSGVVWMEGESLLLTGTPGVGKTTLAGQLVRARLVGGTVLGMEVAPSFDGFRVLYLAMDRPQQIARALARTLGDVPRDILDKRLTVWRGPPLADLAAHPETLLELANMVNADTVVVDSLKDAAIGLSTDDVAAGYNRARQLALAKGVQLLELHHMVKRDANGKAPKGLEDVYGSMHLTSGAGSVVLLHGKAGDPVVDWRHLKQPAEEVGPFLVAHDHAAGRSEIHGTFDPVEAARLAGNSGLTAKGAAERMFDTAKPTPAEVQKARRKLDGLVRADLLVRLDGDDTKQQATRWVYPAVVFDDLTDDDLI